MIALVTGATRGGGRGIAIELAAAGATVYATGRSSRVAGRSPMNRPETIEETATLAQRARSLGNRPEGDLPGGTQDAAAGAIGVRVDHSDPEQVRALIERIEREQGRLDVLVNGVWGGDPLTDWEHPLWEQDLDAGLALLRQAVDTHIITSRYALPLLVRGKRGLVVEITDGVTARYRGSFFYDIAKATVIRLAQAQAAELREHDVAAVALTPGFLRSESTLELLGVTDDNYKGSSDPHFDASERARYLGRAVAALAGDPNVMAKSGRALSTGPLAREYGFTDVDGTQPDFVEYWARTLVDEFGPLGDPVS